ncbi:hypothetical protein [Luteimonas changyuni]|uniref:hypothetical protein n=1 Tax=Luteimonas sp. MJ145 TaxID=3129234 RepID=UPI0031BA51CB
MSRQRQRGMTLIGTLVGLLLSVLGVVAMLALYRTMVDTSTSSELSAVRDSQLASALLGAQMELQAVGWRIEPGTAGDNLRVSADGRGVVWRFRDVDGGPMLCAGMRIVAEAPAAGAAMAGPDGPLAQGLYLMPATPCSGVDDAGVTWATPGQPTPRMLVSAVGFHVGQGEVSVLRLAEARFVQQAGACEPYGQNVGEVEHVTLALEAGGMRLFGVCLQNIKGAEIVPAAATEASA